jgi:hypothetical protein
MSKVGTETVTAGDAVASSSSVVRRVGAVIGSHRSLFELLAVYVCAAAAVDAAIPERSILHLHVYDAVFALMIQVYILVFTGVFVIRELRYVPPDRGALDWLWEQLRVRYLNLSRVTAFVCAAVYGRVLTDTYTSLKAAIPLIQPYIWDATFAGWSRALHAGRYPWELLQPLMTPSVTLALNVVYNAWMFVLFGVFMWQAWSANEALRRRFFLTFGLAWMLLGSVAATGFSSAGPCYYARVTQSPQDPYEPLMKYLRQVDGEHRLWALGVQDALWEAYAHGRDAVPSQPSVKRDADGHASVGQMLEGISAMPSMHVAMSVLFAWLGWAVSRWLGLAFTAFAIVIQIGSVHLGWHYAIDGYVSAVMVTALWFLVGRWTPASKESP